jgi:dsRNA-specific ribonuclease
MVDGKVVGQGNRSKKAAAEQRAARAVLDDLDSQEPTEAEAG